MNVRCTLLSAIVVAGFMTVSHSSALAQRTPLFAILNGGNEVGPTGLAKAGDPDGFGSASITFPVLTSASATLCYSILTANITVATAAHIHRGTAGFNGGIVVPLLAPVGVPGRVANCVAVNPLLAAEIRTFPDRFYVNVHNAAFPGGAIRGQLF